MKKVGKALLGFLVLAGAFAVTPASAQLQFGRMDTGLYLGGAVGGTKYRNACEGVPAGVSCDEKDIGGRAFVGWQFNKWVGVEGGFAYLGKTEITGPGGTATVRARGLDVVGVVTVPLNEMFGVYGKAGLARMRASGTAPGITVTDTDTSLTYGLGARVNFARNFTGRLEWQRFHDISDIKVDFLSIGVLYGFY
jgi:OOP family OmpA-OmpF porin